MVISVWLIWSGGVVSLLMDVFIFIILNSSKPLYHRYSRAVVLNLFFLLCYGVTVLILAARLSWAAQGSVYESPNTRDPHHHCK